jgi:tRNA(adenine34) deaminase
MLETDRFYLTLAIQEAEQAAQEGTFPIGAVLVGPEGQIVSRGRNGVYRAGDYTAHAEIEVIRQAGSLLMTSEYKGKCTLYTTWEPCLMCTGALIVAYIARVVWAANDEIGGALHGRYEYLPAVQSRLALLSYTEAPLLDLAQHSDKLIWNWIRMSDTYKALWLKTTS